MNPSRIAVVSSSVASQSSPVNNLLSQSVAADLYVEDTATVSLAPGAVGPTGVRFGVVEELKKLAERQPLNLQP